MVIVSEVVIIKNAVLNSWMNKVKSLNRYDEVRLAEIKYGLEAFYLTLTKTIIIGFIAIILGIWKEVLALVLCFIPIRTFAAGFHTNTSLQCLILSSFIFLGIPIISKNIVINLNYLRIIYPILLIGYAIFSPKDTHKKPINNNKKRFFLKITSLIIVIIYFILCITINNLYITTLLTLSLIIELIMLSPLPFIIFRQKYNYVWFK